MCTPDLLKGIGSSVGNPQVLRAKTPPAPPPPPPRPERTADRVRAPRGVRNSQNRAAGLGVSALRVPKTDVNIPK